MANLLQVSPHTRLVTVGESLETVSHGLSALLRRIRRWWASADGMVDRLSKHKERCLWDACRHGIWL